MDSTRSWVVAAGCCWTNTFSYAIFRSTAVVFVNILQSPGMTREQASWPISLMAILFCLSAPLAGLLAQHIAIWKLTVSASLMASISLSACCFANTMPLLVVFLGILHGTSLGFFSLFNTVISQHFSRYRTIASGIASSGYTLGGLIFPPVIQVFFDEYGTKGGFLLCGTVALHAVAGALLYRLPPGANKPFPSEINGAHSNSHDAHEGTTTENFRLDVLRNEQSEHPASYKDDSVREAKGEQDTPPTKKAIINQSIKKRVCDNFRAERANATDTTLNKSKDTVGLKKIILPSFFRLPMFYLIAFSYAQAIFNMSTYLTVIVDFATDRNVAKWNAVLLVVLYGLADLASRLGSGWVTDKKFIKGSAMMSLHFFLWAASFCLLASATTYPFQVVAAIIGGWSNGATSTLIPVFVMELVDAQEFSLCFGFVTMIVAVPFSIRPVMIGVFRDTLGDYQGMFFLLAACMVLSALLWLWVSLQERWTEWKSHRSYKNTVQNGSTEIHLRCSADTSCGI